jgi:hypothetical protein
MLVPLASSTQLVANAADREAPKVPQAPSCTTVCITEYMYSGADGAFVEFTNVSGGSIDMTGWSFDDSHRQAGSTDLSAFGTVPAGESVILTEASPSVFRTAWGLASSVQVIQNFNHSLGRDDEINLYDSTNAVVDRLTYNDQSVPATIRAKDASGWVGAAELGNNHIGAWRLSVPCDLQNSIESTGGNLGNPGSYVRDDALPPAIPVSAPAPYLSLPFDNTGFVSGAINDPTDPAAALGITFTVSDLNLSVTATSSNGSTVPQDNAHLNLSQVGDEWNLKITPAAIGCSRITVHASDGTTDVAAYGFGYAASEASVAPANTRFHTGASDASTAIAVDNDYMLVGDDENQNLRLYDRHQSGLPVNGFDFTGDLGLAGSNEVDIEASTRVSNRIFWLGSHSNDSDGLDSPNRWRLFAADLAGSGTNVDLSFVGYYAGLRDDLVQWDQSNGNHYGLANSIIGQPERADGFNIEGLAMAPGSMTTAYIGFRAPLVPTSNRALIVPVTNFTSLVNGTPGTGPALFGAPIELDLGGRGIRSIERNSNDEYLIIAGPPDSATGVAPKDFRLYSWTGNAGDTPQSLPTDLTGLNVGGSFETIVDVPTPLPLDGSQPVQLLVDNGDKVWYGGVVTSKHLPEPNIEKFRSEMVRLGNAPPAAHVTVCSASCDFTTVQAAIADQGTTDGATITIMDPVHTEQGITVYKSVTIQGQGVSTQTILQADATRGSATNRVISIQSGMAVTIRNLTLRYGHAPTGGGVSNEGTLTITHSTIADNDADSYGGGIENFSSGILNVVNTTVSGNVANGNTGSDGGGGLDLFSDGSVTIAYSTIANNSAPNLTDRGGIWLESGSLSIRNSIVAGNGSANCTIEADSTFTPSGENIDSGADCVGFSKPNTDPKLDALNYTSGPGPTHALLSGSPAIDAIAPPCDETTDERGVSRPQGAGCDIGAFELAGSTSHAVYLPAVFNRYSPSLIPAFSHIFIIVMENKNRNLIADSVNAPYINSLAAQYGSATSYYGIRHPSLPNYLALTGGSTFGVASDCNDCYQNADNLAQQLQVAGKSWRAYMESMPTACFGGDGPILSGDQKPLYAQKHNPFYYYDNVRNNSTLCNKLVPFTDLSTDLQAGTLPQFVWITPNQVSDMHGVGRAGETLESLIRGGDDWLHEWVPRILASSAWQNNGLLIITFDEGSDSKDPDLGCCASAPNEHGGGQVETLVISPRVQPGFASTVAYNHYSLLRTIEEALNLPLLGYADDARSKVMSDFFQPSSSTTLVPVGTAWKYLDDGSNQGTAWHDSAYNDGAWKQGNAQLGYGDGDETTKVNCGPSSPACNSNNYITTYFRRAFSVSDPASYKALDLQLLRDDGTVVYLNGQEVLRSNMPAGNIAYDTPASTAIGGAGELTWYHQSVNPSLLVAGTNVLAVELHQAGPTSSDISFDLGLTGTR